MLIKTLQTCATIALLSAFPKVAICQQKQQNDSLYTRKVHHKALTVDAHIDVRPDFNAVGNEATKETPDQFDLPKLERGDLDVATVALFADPLKRTPENIRIARKQIDTKLGALQRFVSQNPDRLEFAYTSADLLSIPARGKHAILLSFLNALSLGKDINMLDTLYRSGVRVFGFTHVGNNDWAASSRPSAAFGDREDDYEGGLSAIGKQAVPKLNKSGMIIDVSQLTKKGLHQVLQLSRAPVIASHSGVSGILESPRNLSDEELKAIAAKGGVVHIVAVAPYLRNNPEYMEAYIKEVLDPFGLKTFAQQDFQSTLDAKTYQKYLDTYKAFSRTEWKYGTLAEFLDAVDYAVKLIGVDHVGLSSDFNHGGGVTGFSNVGDAPNVTKELLRRGYTEQDIDKLWGGNFLRVFREVENVAKQSIK
jgi:membrane dipeptidase